MNGKLLSLAAGAVAFLSMVGAGYAQDAKLTSAQLAEQQSKVKIASGVIALGRAEKDPMMLLVGAKILADLGLPVADPASGDASKAYDVSAILAEAKGLAGDSQYLLDAIAAVPAVRAERGERYCGWDYDCLGSGTYECSWVYSCDW
jgi:hypothetical protein